MGAVTVKMGMSDAADQAGAQPVERLAYTSREAASALGVGITYFRETVQPELRVMQRGRLVLISVRELERWIKARSEPAPAARTTW